MISTKTIVRQETTDLIRIALVVLFTLACFGIATPLAHADSNLGSSASHAAAREGGSDASKKTKMNALAPRAGLSGGGFANTTQFNDAMNRLADKIAELEEKKQELLKKMQEKRSETPSGLDPNAGPGKRDRERDSDSSNSGHGKAGEWKEKFCSGASTTGPGIGGGYTQLSDDVRKRICERWNRASSTPRGDDDSDDMRGTSTERVRVQHPNGGTAYKHPIDGAVVIKWQNTTSDKTVDIDLVKGSTTTSIAKNVSGKRVHASLKSGRSSDGGDVRGASDARPGGGLGYSGAMMNKGKAPVYGYRWSNAPVGEGYKIRITAKVGDTEYSDESNKTFSVKKLKSGMNWYETDSATSGDVLGASTTAEMQSHLVLDHLEDILIEMSVALSS